ncbi:MAG: Cu(I)-responsive transcriptional regulator [Pigmentiphaga sp.]|nr:Cu(I)-responsive transcriptional regulator [Pigmentiphaga sp.]
MNIGEAAKASQVSAKMIRYYEQIGLIPPVGRTDAGYRVYNEADIHRLNFIRRARDLGFSVAEIGNLLSLWNDQSRQSADVKRLAEQHIAELEQRMANLRQMTDTLKTLIACCAGDDRPDCPILDELQQSDEGLAERQKRSGAVIRRQ